MIQLITFRSLVSRGAFESSWIWVVYYSSSTRDKIIELEFDFNLHYSSLNSNSSLIKSNQVKTNSIEPIRVQLSLFKSNKTHAIEINILYIILNKRYYRYFTIINIKNFKIYIVKSSIRLIKPSSTKYWNSNSTYEFKQVIQLVFELGQNKLESNYWLSSSRAWVELLGSVSPL